MKEIAVHPCLDIHVLHTTQVLPFSFLHTGHPSITLSILKLRETYPNSLPWVAKPFHCAISSQLHTMKGPSMGRLVTRIHFTLAFWRLALMQMWPGKHLCLPSFPLTQIHPETQCKGTSQCWAKLWFKPMMLSLPGKWTTNVATGMLPKRLALQAYSLINSNHETCFHGISDWLTGLYKLACVLTRCLVLTNGDERFSDMAALYPPV